ncbi:WecB/TagA/CpsF family glycosyltransferase [Pseudarthrobacter sp. NPDC092439]|uniref:WecB/TagA/CpsF family glycosyltransferase n=1 Tax=unclassified Pseudarthrobacter TaxID=2647000 RepID=UPI0037F27A48
MQRISYRLHGLKIHDVSMPEAADAVVSFAADGRANLVVTPNSDHYLRWQDSPAFRELYGLAALVVPDGFPLVLMAHLEGRRSVQRIPGVDLFYASMRLAAQTGIPVGLIGGKQGVAGKAAQNLAAVMPGLRVFLTESPNPEELADPAYVADLRSRLGREPAKVVALCLGSPKQEELFRALTADGNTTGCYLGVGAAIDFAAGEVRRAPRAVQDAGLEWLYRLGQEPRRLWKRYLHDTRIFGYVARSTAAGVTSSALALVARTVGATAVFSSGVHLFGSSGSASQQGKDASMRIVHVGPDPQTQGGMASVIAEYLTFTGETFTSSSIPTWAPRSRFRSLGNAARLCLQILVGQHDRNTLHVHMSEFGSFIREGAVVLAAHMRAVPVLVSLHGADFGETVARYPGITRNVLSKASGIICLGPKQKAMVARLVPRVTTHIVPNPSGPGTSAGLPERLAAAGSAPHFVFAGDVGTRKGFDLIQTVWPEVIAKYPGATLDVCGPVTDVAAPIELPRCTYHGTVTREKVAELLLGAECLLLPSRKEVLPMSALEALRLGTHVIASHAGEMDSLAGSAAVTYCDPTPDALLAAITSVLESTPADKQARSEKAIRWSAENSSNERIALLLQHIYTSHQRTSHTSQGGKHCGKADYQLRHSHARPGPSAS